MTMPDGYSRAQLGYARSQHLVPGGSDPLTSDDCRSLIGSELTVSLHDVVIAEGAITDCRITEDGQHLLITVETGGRWCAACGRVYREDEADNRMAPIGVLRESWVGRYPATLAAYADLPSWVRVCTAWADCEHHRLDNNGGSR